MNHRVLICSLLCWVISPLATAGEATPVKIIAPLAVQGALKEIQPLLQSKVGAPVRIEYITMARVVERVSTGEAADVTIVSQAGAEQLAAKGLVKSQLDLVQSEVGIAVADNAPTPVLKTTEDFIAFLKAVPSIAYFGISGSGALLTKFAEQHGLAEVLKTKGVPITEGYTSTWVRDGKAASAIQQISELKFGGANNIAPLPESIQVRSVNCLVVLRATQQAAVADKVVQVLTSPEAAGIYQRAGLKPLFK